MLEYDFQNSIGFIINRTARAFVKALDLELREKVGVTVGQWKVIVMLVKQNGLTQKEIADRLGLEGPTLIPIIDKMEKEGLVVRRVDSADRRNNRIYRTDKADALWNRMVECATKVRQISVKDISEENISSMRNVLDNIWQNLRIEFDVGCGAAADNSIVLVESMGKSSSNILSSSTIAATTDPTTTTRTTIPTTPTSAKKRRTKS
jgi:MarR family transcriptional regulator, transcriptional regulator for hemolysin